MPIVMSVNAAHRGAFDQLIEHRDDSFVAFVENRFLPKVLRSEKFFEQLGRNKLPQNLLS